jgi:LPS export ABC transporter permease LptF/LPS export ABC transporter permease LptG
MTRPRFDLIWRYVFSEVLSPSLLGLVVYVLVFITNALFELAELAIKKDMPLGTVGLILLYYLPRVLIMTIPMSLLLGILVGIGRMSTDSEIVALRASGVSYWRILSPALVLGLLTWGISSLLIIRIEPRANYRRHHIYQELLYSADLRREIKPRVFFEEIPGMLLYADQVHQNGDFLEKVFIHQAGEDGKELVTVARRAQIDYDRRNGVALFYLQSGTTHSTTPGEAESYQVSNFDREMIRKEPDESFRLRSSLLSRPAPKNWREQSLSELAESARKAGTITHDETRDRVIGTILSVVHERFALPFACLVFALIGLPLGIMNRRGGRASGFSLSIGIAVIYWILLLAGENLVSQGKLSPYIGLWVGNVILGVLGIVLFLLRERSESFHLIALIPGKIRRGLALLRMRKAARERTGSIEGGAQVIPLRRTRDGDIGEPGSAKMDEVGGGRRLRASILGLAAAVAGLASASYSPFLLVALVLLAIVLIFSTTIDRYVLARFGVILFGCLTVLFSLFAIYEFINLIDDLVERRLPLSLAFSYVKFHSPWILSQVLPMSSLVSTVMTFGIMSRFNEVTAVKASGTSIYRLAIPVVMITVVLSTLAYVNQEYLMPYANVRASQIRDAIRGRGARSYEQLERRWVFGEEGRLYNFSNYNPSPLPVLGASTAGTFQGFSAYLLDPDTFALRQRIYARTATFEEGRWVLNNGWLREFQDGKESFETFVEKRFAFPEGPSYFIKDWKTPEQMTYAELSSFVRDLRRRGYDVQELMVELYGKTSFPLVSLTMVILGLPFCFRMGRRGSFYGVGIALALVTAFLVAFSATNALGGIGAIPPFLAAWAPNILFAGTGVYLLLRTGT